MNNITQSLKLIALALILSVGISYVSAWTAPTVTPPGGNTSAPINVSVNSQTKAGDLKADTLYAYSFKDQNNPAYYLDPTVDSILTNIYATKICFSPTDCKTAWPSGGTTYSAGNGLSLSGTIFSINNTQTQARVSGSCAVGSSIRAINADGTVSCETSGAGTGMTGILMPLAGKTISCFYNNGYSNYVYAYVDATGNPFTRAATTNGNRDTGWVAGFSAEASNLNNPYFVKADWNISSYPSLIGTIIWNNGSNTGYCYQNWPAT